MPHKFIYRRFIARLLQINDTPEAIALGTALGMVVAMTPTVGIQMIIILIICTFIRANRLAGVVMVYVSNPLTLVPIYWLDYRFGALVLGKDSITQAEFKERFSGFMDTMDHAGILAAFPELGRAFVNLGWEITVPMFVGGTIIGILLALPLYPLTLRAVRGHQRRREHHKAVTKLRELRRAQRRELSQSELPAAETHPDPETSEQGGSVENGEQTESSGADDDPVSKSRSCAE